MLSTNKLRHPFPELTREPSVTICDKLLAQTMESPDPINIELCKIFRRQVFSASHKMHHFCKLIDKDTNTIIPSFRLGQLNDKVKRDSFPRLLWNRKRLQCTKGPVATGLISLAQNTAGDILGYILCQRCPPKQTTNCLSGLLYSIVSRVRRIVILCDNLPSQINVIRDNYYENSLLRQDLARWYSAGLSPPSLHLAELSQTTPDY